MAANQHSTLITASAIAVYTARFTGEIMDQRLGSSSASLGLPGSEGRAVLCSALLVMAILRIDRRQSYPIDCPPVRSRSSGCAKTSMIRTKQLT